MLIIVTIILGYIIYIVILNSFPDYALNYFRRKGGLPVTYKQKYNAILSADFHYTHNIMIGHKSQSKLVPSGIAIGNISINSNYFKCTYSNLTFYFFSVDNKIERRLLKNNVNFTPLGKKISIQFNFSFDGTLKIRDSATISFGKGITDIDDRKQISYLTDGIKFIFYNCNLQKSSFF
jgi:hypothetical protein